MRIWVHWKKKGTIRNLKRVSRIATNSEPFLGFVRIRFRINLFCEIQKKGFCRSGFVLYPSLLQTGIGSIPISTLKTDSHMILITGSNILSALDNCHHMSVPVNPWESCQRSNTTNAVIDDVIYDRICVRLS
jgi:hypothetical protein